MNLWVEPASGCLVFWSSGCYYYSICTVHGQLQMTFECCSHVAGCHHLSDQGTWSWHTSSSTGKLFIFTWCRVSVSSRPVHSVKQLGHGRPTLNHPGSSRVIADRLCAMNFLTAKGELKNSRCTDYVKNIICDWHLLVLCMQTARMEHFSLVMWLPWCGQLMWSYLHVLAPSSQRRVWTNWANCTAGGEVFISIRTLKWCAHI